jgi:sugar phosphate isomerase/epimerase
MKEHTLGAQLYTVRQFTQTIPDIAETLKMVVDIGYTAIQISAFGSVAPKEVTKLVEANGLTVACTHMGWDRFLNELEEVIAVHKLWGCVHLAIGGLLGEYRSLDGLKQFLDELAPVAKRLNEEGMDFSYHNHNHGLMRYGAKTWLAMLYERDPFESLAISYRNLRAMGLS